jgi:predicted HTH transcriptional regulator/tetratricopeptide (TPR) repeat protein
MLIMKSSKRIPFVCSALSGDELQAGSRDVTNIYRLLTSPDFGACQSKGHNPICDCPSRVEFDKLLLNVLTNWDSRNQFVFYFSGHGEFQGNQYCLKFGEHDFYPFQNLINDLGVKKVSRAILVLDACHSAAVIGDKGGNILDLGDVQIPKGIVIIASCGITQVSQERSDGSSSVFTDLFCRGIETGLGGKYTNKEYITVEDIVDYIRDELDKNENQNYRQRPVYKTDKVEGLIWIAKNQSFTKQQNSGENTENSPVDFLSNDNHLNYDRQIVQLYTIEHLDHRILTLFLEQPLAKQELRRSGLLRASLLEHLSLMGLMQGYRPTLGAFLCFAPKTLLVDKYASCGLHLAVYSGNKRSTSTSSPDFKTDNLLNLFEFGMEFFSTKAGLQRTGYIGTERRDDLEIPEIALKEALANALVHRDYESPNLREQPTRIDVYSDRVEITSYGSLLGGITAKDLNENPEELTPFRRNHIIADIFRIMQRVELNASGVSRMHEATKLANLPPPEIKTPTNQILKVVFFRPTDNLKARFVSTSIPQNLPRSGVVNFVGRDEKLKQLHTQLQQTDRITITSIVGMGGVGKTELALQYGIDQLQQGQYSAGICWLRARDREIATELVTFAQIHLGLNIPEQLGIDDQVRFCWQQWPDGEALIILDDVTDYHSIESYLPPADTRFKLLITTRLDLGRSVQKIAIEELDEDASIALLESLVGKERIRTQIVDAQTLCQWVGYLPLALELLGRFLTRKLDWSIDRLLKSLQEKQLESKALLEPESGMTSQSGIIAALELSWRELNEPEQELACVLSMFATTPIPWSLVESCLLDIEPDDLEETRDNGLVARSLLKRIGEGTYLLHQLVQEYFRIKLQQRNDQGQSIKISFWQVMVGIAQTIDEASTIDRIERVREIIPHLEEGIRAWVDSITNRDLIWPFVGVGRFYIGQANYRFAEPWFRECLVVTRSKLGGEHPDVARSLNNLAELYRTQGRYAEAEPLYLEAMEMCRLEPDVASSLNNLAEFYRAQGKYEEAEPLYLEAMGIYRRLLGEEHPDIASSLNNLAELYRAQGKYEEAEPLYLEAMGIYRRLLGEEHPDIATSLNNLAGLYSSQGKYEEAEPLYLEALERSRQRLGEEHPGIARSLNNLASLYSSQEKYNEAEPLYIAALEMYKRLLGEEHPDVATSLNNLASLYSSQGKYMKAESLYLEALEKRKRLLGEEHPDVATSRWNLGVLYQDQGKYFEAEALYRQALKVVEAKLGKNHPYTKGILNWLNSLPNLPKKVDD